MCWPILKTVGISGLVGFRGSGQVVYLRWGGGLHILCVRESRVSLMARWCSSLFEVHMECSLQGVASPLKGGEGEHMISNVGCT